MDSKKQPSKKVLDISRPKKRSAAAADVPSAPQLVIPKRSIIVPVSDDSAETLAPVQTAAKRVQVQNIEPVTDSAPTPTDSKSATLAVPEPAQAPTAPPVAPTPPVAPEPPAPQQPSPEPLAPLQPETPTKPAPPAQPAAQPNEPAPETPATSEKELDSTDTADTNTTSSKASADVQKALQDAKREQEIQGYIDNREFFVPINTAARKRSLRVSLVLVFVEILLGLFLINLMLDAGLIYLVEKIPHTHFFN